MSTRLRFARLSFTQVVALLLLGAVGHAYAQPRVTPLGNGNVSVDMDGCSILFNTRGGIVTQGRDCSSGDVRDARNAFNSYQREQGGATSEAPPGGFRPSNQPRVNALRNGNVSVDMDGCSVLFNSSGGIVTQGRDCSNADVRSARTAFNSYRREQGSSASEAPPGGFRPSNGRGSSITAYADFDYRGANESFSNDIPNMSQTRVGNDNLSSLRIPDGCRVTAYTDTDYRGRSVVLTNDVANIGRAGIGNDQVSSMRVSCGGSQRSVTLFGDFDFRGDTEAIFRDVPEMGRTRVGNDSLSSIRVPRGCEVTLYADNDYRGRSVRLSRDESNMSRTDLGNDSVSSIRLNCR